MGWGGVESTKSAAFHLACNAILTSTGLGYENKENNGGPSGTR